MRVANLYSPVFSGAEEVFQTLAAGEHTRIERIVSHGQCSPEGFWYDQPDHEWVALLTGAARLRFADGRELGLRPGDHLLIPAGQRHRVAWTAPNEPTVWLAVFYRAAPPAAAQ